MGERINQGHKLPDENGYASDYWINENGETSTGIVGHIPVMPNVGAITSSFFRALRERGVELRLDTIPAETDIE